MLSSCHLWWSVAQFACFEWPVFFFYSSFFILYPHTSFKTWLRCPGPVRMRPPGSQSWGWKMLSGCLGPRTAPCICIPATEVRLYLGCQEPYLSRSLGATCHNWCAWIPIYLFALFIYLFVYSVIWLQTESEREAWKTVIRWLLIFRRCNDFLHHWDPQNFPLTIQSTSFYLS